MSRVLLLGLALLAAAAASWRLSRPQEVTTVSPKRGDAAEIVYATGVVEPRTWAKVAPLLRERIVELCNCEGESVERGAVLARLDSRQPEATLAELKARQKLTMADYDRIAALVERRVASDQALDRARSELGQIQALIAGQETRLESYVLRAPMSGVVLRQDGEVGEAAEPGTILFWVGEPKPLQVEADVNEEDIPRVAVGQRAVLKADAFPDQVLDAKVDSVTPKGDPIAKTYRVHLALPQDTPLRIGMTVEVNAIVRIEPGALLVPTNALRGGALFVLDGAVARRRDVTVGIRGASNSQIRQGLSDTDRVIAPFPDELADGTKVRERQG
ncbi:efflux RND transporter periplasmic adaptor subunit [Microvirga sp. HBU67558]|uniref:efflux RND transporter periplasmic adaptor subunit n=1 Tax=Microvirga TaxID=186650 RepID=UPI001B35B7B4|nr:MULTISPECIES: efflux RND transporter periplasmic adaptor subunit [unclassified Microvirga]MBQ0823629.1 efflux RND transporter periplasmic adaptor subunit [Microvirga sp. HBU67558]